MSEQSAKETILSKTLQVLVKQQGLSLEELGQIRLSHLHLAGKSPAINFTPEGSQEAKVITLDLEMHRALVSWLVNRPDSITDFLFPGQGSEGMSLAEIQQALQATSPLADPLGPTSTPFPPAPPEVDEGLPPAPPPSASRPVKPFSRPEAGPPPVGSEGAPVSFQPPPAPPEADEAGDIPLPPATPSAAPPPVGVTPSQPVAPIKPPEPAPARSPMPEPVQPTPPVDTTLVSAKKPDPPASEVKPAPPASKPATPVQKATPVKQPSSPIKTAGSQIAPPTAGRPRFFVPGIALAALVLCGLCIVGGWFAGQSEAGGQLLASLGLSRVVGGANQATPVEATSETSIFESVPPTPTLPPTSTLTPLPPTNTPVPTDTSTATSAPTDTPTTEATDTPAPTDTPVPPTDTPEPTAEPTEPPTAEAPPTPALKYPAPELVEPSNEFAFIQGNTIVLRWKPVDLAANEQYAVRMVYPYQGQPTYQGSNIKEPEWIVPLALFGQIDPPENRYEWFVVIERVNEDGSGTAISPESEHRFFTWK
jgi:hypothetical protein